MTTHATARGALLAAAVFVASASRASAQPIRRASDEPAWVEKNRIVIFLPLPYAEMKAPEPPVAGYFVWRITVETLQPFSVVVMSDTALRTSRSADVLRASTVRLCADPTVESARACTLPTSASMEIAGDHFRIILRDAALVARVRRERPAMYWRYVVEPGGRYALTQHPFAHQAFERP